MNAHVIKKGCYLMIYNETSSLKMRKLKRSRGNDFVLCGYFSHKLDAYIHMELKTEKFDLQNSGHGSASKLVTRGRV